MSGDDLGTIEPASVSAYETAIEPEQKAPYPGLKPFEYFESDIFYGRDVQIAGIISRLRNSRWRLFSRTIWMRKIIINVCWCYFHT